MNEERKQQGSWITAEVWRGPIRESIHNACFAASDPEGRLLSSGGDADFVTTLRSAAKPLQAVPLTLLSESLLHNSLPADFNDEELAICCASHPGLPRHAALAASVLALSGVPPDDLVCGPGGSPPVEIRHGCSGNHACILLIAHLLGAPLWGYEKPDHPAQQEIARAIREMSGARDMQIGLDGCGVPTFGLTLREMARAFAVLNRAGAAWERIPRVMTAHPELIGADDWIDVRLMQATRGRLMAKTGADGLLCVGVPGHGLGMAVKVADGRTRALGICALEALKQAEWISAQELESPLLVPFLHPRILASTGEVAAEIRLTLS